MKALIYIVTGMSGSGKTTFIHILEDNGFYCVDNIPVVLVPKFLELVNFSSEPIEKVGLVLDIRERGFFEGFLPVINQLKSLSFSPYIFFLECSDAVLIKRYK